MLHDFTEVQYLGCYEDQRERDLDGSHDNFENENSIEKCAAHCKNQGKNCLENKLTFQQTSCSVECLLFLKDKWHDDIQTMFFKHPQSLQTARNGNLMFRACFYRTKISRCQ